MELDELTANSMADLFGELCKSGYIRIMSSNRIIVELQLNEKAFKKASGGKITANRIEAATAFESGTVDKYEVYKKDGTTRLLTGSVGLIDSDSDLKLPTVDIVKGSKIEIDSYIHYVPNKTEKQG